MRVLLFLLFVGPVSVWASVLDCVNVYTMDMDDKGNLSFSPSGTNIEVSESTTGKYGYVAKITLADGQNSTETDVKVETLTSVTSQIEQIVLTARPDIVLKNVTKIIVANIGVDANASDSGGMYIYELRDSKDAVLGKVASIGWGLARCEK